MGNVDDGLGRAGVVGRGGEGEVDGLSEVDMCGPEELLDEGRVGLALAGAGTGAQPLEALLQGHGDGGVEEGGRGGVEGEGLEEAEACGKAGGEGAEDGLEEVVEALVDADVRDPGQGGDERREGHPQLRHRRYHARQLVQQLQPPAVGVERTGYGAHLDVFEDPAALGELAKDGGGCLGACGVEGGGVGGLQRPLALEDRRGAVAKVRPRQLPDARQCEGHLPAREPRLVLPTLSKASNPNLTSTEGGGEAGERSCGRCAASEKASGDWSRSPRRDSALLSGGTDPSLSDPGLSCQGPL